MRAWRSALALAVGLTLAPAAAPAQGGPFGAGIIIGEPTGLSLKLFLDQRNALVGALDFSFVDDTMYVHVDYLWHFSPYRARGGGHYFLPYIGIGGKLGVHDRGRGKHDDDRAGALGVRVPLGVAWMPGGVPLDVFLEIVPGIRLIPETDPDVDAGLGIRYFF